MRRERPLAVERPIGLGRAHDTRIGIVIDEPKKQRSTAVVMARSDRPTTSHRSRTDVRYIATRLDSTEDGPRRIPLGPAMPRPPRGSVLPVKMSGGTSEPRPPDRKS